MCRRALEREDEVTREEENRKVTDEILGMSGKEADFKSSLIMNANMIVSLLVDISRSLAVIADNLEEQPHQLRAFDENLKVEEING
jgi:hypothetical protein